MYRPDKYDLCQCGNRKTKKSKYCQFCFLHCHNPTTNIKNHKLDCSCGVCQTKRKEKKYAFKKGKPHCINCGKILSNYNNKRCKVCQYKFFSGKNHSNYGKTNNWKRIKYNNIWMKSTWELKYAEYLDKQGIKWLYEPKAFDLGNTTYTPDFYLPESDTYVEIKGFWRKISINKFLAFRLFYPDIKINILIKKDLKQMRIL